MTAHVDIDEVNIEALKASKEGAFSYKNVQYAIEQVYDLRSKVIRIGFLGMLIHRPDPDRPTDPEEQRGFLAALESEVAEFDQVTELIKTGKSFGQINPVIAQWMSAVAHQNPDNVALALRVNALCQRVLEAATTRSSDQSDAIREHRDVARAGYHDAVTELCLFMWRSYDKDQSARLHLAQAAAVTLSARLKRLERIGTHVRMVSLNASVEASHIGEAGRGLSLIAQEFKGLAEEVTVLAQEARSDVDAMQEHS